MRSTSHANQSSSTESTQVRSVQECIAPQIPEHFVLICTAFHTSGYEWNKYNQTHYDSDNPPPKVVQGYKFNLFYPDLIDKALHDSPLLPRLLLLPDRHPLHPSAMAAWCSQ